MLIEGPVYFKSATFLGYLDEGESDIGFGLDPAYPNPVLVLLGMAIRDAVAKTKGVDYATRPQVSRAHWAQSSHFSRSGGSPPASETPVRLWLCRI